MHQIYSGNAEEMNNYNDNNDDDDFDDDDDQNDTVMIKFFFFFFCKTRYLYHNRLVKNSTRVVSNLTGASKRYD